MTFELQGELISSCVISPLSLFSNFYILKSHMWMTIRHPGGDNGHRLLFDLVSSTLMRGSHSLIPRMYNAEIEDDIVMGSLPEPIFKDNYEAGVMFLIASYREMLPVL